ncbi:hypothetical protein OG204_01400 [Streptomyces sp. NBC_01387]|uniref:hypothetical protein n=1 Tax=unclassified Streptomyces TaxID=2593676 RepID=UPI00202457FB|nr:MULTISPECIES: hypothetical protein [unclassified Streptomyces]MCX4553047.1 hypothetical protein [Streptomyces sp. NBC_01500]WSC24368.1 hypothetical protein OIE60_34410 [Streptomyces sp. NBC_01766]WSV58252.1 hypothetical protein OG282_33725 [Streptomyces sp. NBC_01014]
MAGTPKKDSVVEEEPQEVRGPKGSRDTGSDKPSGGPADRTPGTSDEQSDTSVQPKKPRDPDSPHLQSGGS